MADVSHLKINKCSTDKLTNDTKIVVVRNIKQINNTIRQILGFRIEKILEIC